MKNTQKHHNPKVKSFNFKSSIVLSLITLNTFGHKALTFFDKLFTVSDGPFAGLNKGQLRKMSWLYCMYR